jgi:prepilin-type N-terminal cleavage/methylation domain-containing protein
MTRSGSDTRGFTLVEVLVALAILLTGIIAVLIMFPLSLQQARLAAERSVSSTAAQSVLSQVRATSAETLYNGQLLPELLVQTRSASNIYGYSTSVQRLSGAAEVYLQRVTFTVTLSNGRTESFTTFVAEQ